MAGVFVASERRTVGGSTAIDTQKHRECTDGSPRCISKRSQSGGVSWAAAQAMTMAISAFWAWRRFSAPSQAAELGPCSTSWVISWP